MTWRELKDARRAKGLCLHCGLRARLSDGGYCGSCLRKRSASRRLLYSRRLRSALCPGCGGERDISPGVIHCRGCIQKARVRNARYVVDRVKAAERMVRLRRERRKEGQCPECGSRRENPRRVCCLKCRRRNGQYKVAKV